jgi:hypothetical protein
LGLVPSCGKCKELMWYNNDDVWICDSCKNYVRKFGREYICMHCGPFELMEKRYLEHDHKCSKCGNTVFIDKKHKLILNTQKIKKMTQNTQKAPKTSI